MGIIAAHNDIIFEPSDKLFSRVKRDLKSYNQAGLLDANDFHDLVMEVLSDLGIGGLLEQDAVLDVKNGKVHVPENFKSLYAAYVCQASGTGNNPRLQNGYAFYTDTTYQNVSRNKCDITCPSLECGTKVTVREYVQGLENIHNFELKTAIREVPFSSFRTNPNEISHNNGYLYTGFNEGTLYIKYYAYPIDTDTGLPLVPNVSSIQKAIRYKIIYESFLNWYLNDEVPNVAQKAAETKQMYMQAFSQASYEVKLPSFMTLVDAIRNKRESLNIYRQTDQNT